MTARIRVAAQLAPSILLLVAAASGQRARTVQGKVFDGDHKPMGTAASTARSRMWTTK